MEKFYTTRKETGIFQAQKSLSLGKVIIWPLLLLLTLVISGTYAQLPTFNYAGPQSYTQNTAITPLAPTASGVAALAYSSFTNIIYGSGITTPYGLAFDSNGNLFVATGTQIEELPAGGGNAVAYGPVFQYARAIAIDASNNLYVADKYANRVYKIPAGGGPAVTLATIQTPNGIAVDASGYIYVTQESLGDLWKLPATGGTPLLLGSYGALSLQGIATDAAGNIYLSDYNTSSVIKVPPAGGAGTTIGTGFSSPIGLVADPAGNIFVCDQNNVVKMIPVGGGAPITIGSGFVLPSYITQDKYGNLYVSDLNAQVNGNPKKINRTGGYFISPNLPLGLNFDEGTGTISGTPTVVSPATNYLVTAFNSSGKISKTLNVKVLPALNSHFAGLSQLKLSAGALSPGFSPAITDYTATVVNGVRSLLVTPAVPSSLATIKINGFVVASNTASMSIALAVGANIISIVVTAPDGTTNQTYTLTVNRPGTGNYNLSSIKRSVGTLSTVFTAATTSYTSSVVNGVESMTVTPTAADPDAVITVNGTSVSSGTTSPQIALSVGVNTITIAVSSSDGTANKTYTLTITRNLSGNANLSAFVTSAGTFSPDFTPLQLSYTITVGYADSAITITPTTANSFSTVKVNGITVTTGTASGLIPLAVGSNTINTVVKAPDGVTTKTYTLTVIRIGLVNAQLSALSISPGNKYDPVIKTGTTNYNAVKTYADSIITVIPITSDPGATVTVNGVAVVSGSPSGPIALTVGNNSINIMVTASDGNSSLNYMITVNRYSAVLSNTQLSTLTINNGILTPAFTPTTLTYTDTVANNIEDVNLDFTPAGQFVFIEVNGISAYAGIHAGPINLAVGANTISIKIISGSELDTGFYTITVTRAPAPINNFFPGTGLTNTTETLKPADDGILVHQALSLNGDGVNDFLHIDNINQYPNNKLDIINRNGDLVFEAKGYNNSNKVFDGHSSKTGHLQLPGTYFYSLNYTVKGVAKHKTGFIVLKY